jgi:hypothetical protein
VPYGVKKSLGGDTAAADAWIHKCKVSVMKGGTSELSAILICKSQYQKMQSKRRKRG